MKMLRSLIPALAVSIAIPGLSGCERVDQVRQSGEERINRASPPPAPLLQAAERARAKLKNHAAALTAFNNQYNGLMRVRAVECAKGYSPS